jgi:hypothetical protein
VPGIGILYNDFSFAVGEAANVLVGWITGYGELIEGLVYVDVAVVEL